MLGIVSKIVNFIIRLVHHTDFEFLRRRSALSYRCMFLLIFKYATRSLGIFLSTYITPCVGQGSKHRWCFFCGITSLPTLSTPRKFLRLYSRSHQLYKSSSVTCLLIRPFGPQNSQKPPQVRRGLQVGIKVSFASISATEKNKQKLKKKKE